MDSAANEYADYKEHYLTDRRLEKLADYLRENTHEYIVGTAKTAFLELRGGSPHIIGGVSHDVDVIGDTEIYKVATIDECRKMLKEIVNKSWSEFSELIMQLSDEKAKDTLKKSGLRDKITRLKTYFDTSRMMRVKTGWTLEFKRIDTLDLDKFKKENNEDTITVSSKLRFKCYTDKKLVVLEYIDYIDFIIDEKNKLFSRLRLPDKTLWFETVDVSELYINSNIKYNDLSKVDYKKYLGNRLSLGDVFLYVLPENTKVINIIFKEDKNETFKVGYTEVGRDSERDDYIIYDYTKEITNKDGSKIVADPMKVTHWEWSDDIYFTNDDDIGFRPDYSMSDRVFKNNTAIAYGIADEAHIYADNMITDDPLYSLHSEYIHPRYFGDEMEDYLGYSKLEGMLGRAREQIQMERSSSGYDYDRDSIEKDRLRDTIKERRILNYFGIAIVKNRR